MDFLETENQENEFEIDQLEEKAKRGDAISQCDLAIRYYYGNGMVENKEKALEWFKKSAEQGNSKAQNYLGVMYYNGTGVHEDRKEGALWYFKAAKQDNDYALYNLETAAKRGNEYAQNNLAYMYYTGDGVLQDNKKAAQWYRRAAKKGNSDAQRNLASMYYHGYGVPENKKLAVDWYTKAAENGNASAQRSLGIMYYYGYGVPKNKKTSIDWYTKASEQGLVIAQYSLASMYYHGDGVSENKKIAVNWYTKASEQGLAIAQYNLAVILSKGQDVPKDKEKAIEWLKKSAEQGEERAQKYLASILNTEKAELKKDLCTGINYIDEYYKYWIYEDGEKFINPEFSDKCGGYILEVKNGKVSGINYYEKKLIEAFSKIDVTNSWITIVPSSKKDKLNDGMCKLINRVVSHLTEVKFCKCLNRKYTIEKLATGGNRSIKTHLNSIELCGERSEFFGEKIYLIDDIMTTGNSLLACKKILEDAGAKVVCIALGKTAGNSEKLSEGDNDKKYLYNLDKEIQKILNMRKYIYLNQLIKDIGEKYEKCKIRFNKYEKLIFNKEELRSRRREVYLYLIKQLNYLNRIDDYGFDEISDDGLDVLEMILYRDLIYDNYDTCNIPSYLSKIRNFQKRYGYMYDMSNIMKEFENTSFYLTEYSTENFDFREIDKMSNASCVYNDIAKGLYESNTDISFENALKNINKAIELSPNERQLYLNRILILIKRDEFKITLKNINEVINLVDESKVYIVKFDNYKKIISSWLEKWNELINSAESNYLTAMFIYEICLSRSLSYNLKFGNIFKRNDGLTHSEKKVKNYLKLANEKSNGYYKEFTDTELMYKSLENEYKENSYKDKYEYEKKTSNCIYRYGQSEIDKLLRIQETRDNYCDYDYTSGADWLGGVQSEKEFWDH